MASWKDKLVDASFRGVAFKVEEENAGIGRRVVTHEYPNRDKPYTEDLGKVTLRPSISAYLIGDDCFEQRDQLIEALNKSGPGTLIHPTYGEMSVCVDGEIRVSTSNTEGRMVRFDLKFVEAGELSYPTSGAATAQNLASSCSALDDCISDNFDDFSIDGVADFIQNDVVGTATEMMGYVSDGMKIVDTYVSDAARLMQGDISVLLPPPSSGKTFVDQLQKMWRTSNRLYGNATDLFTMIKTFSGISLGSDLAPRGVWKTDSVTTKIRKQQSNYVASAIRTTAISEAAYAVTNLPAPASPALVTHTPTSHASASQGQQTGWPKVTHPALNNAPASQSPARQSRTTQSVVSQAQRQPGGTAVTQPALNNAPEVSAEIILPTWDELVEIRETLSQAIDTEMARTTDDRLFLALRRVKADVHTDIKNRLEQTGKTVIRTPNEVVPALVLAATWFDNAARDTDITRRNAIAHPGFVPVTSLKVPAR